MCLNLCLCHTCIVSLLVLMNARVTLAGFFGRSVCILPRCRWWAIDAANEGDWQANIQSSVLASLLIYLSDCLSTCLSVSLFVCVSLCVSVCLSVCNWNAKLANVIVCFSHSFTSLLWWSLVWIIREIRRKIIRTVLCCFFVYWIAPNNRSRFYRFSSTCWLRFRSVSLCVLDLALSPFF